MNCNDCGGFLPRGCECSPFGGRKTRADDEAFRQHQRDRIAEAQRHDAEQAKPKLTDGVSGPLPLGIADYLRQRRDYCLQQAKDSLDGRIRAIWMSDVDAFDRALRDHTSGVSIPDGQVKRTDTP